MRVDISLLLYFLWLHCCFIHWLSICNNCPSPCSEQSSLCYYGLVGEYCQPFTGWVNIFLNILQMHWKTCLLHYFSLTNVVKNDMFQLTVEPSEKRLWCFFFQSPILKPRNLLWPAFFPAPCLCFITFIIMLASDKLNWWLLKSYQATSSMIHF